MTQEEALKEIKKAMPYMWAETKEAIQTLIPELKESKAECAIHAKFIGDCKEQEYKD